MNPSAATAVVPLSPGQLGIWNAQQIAPEVPLTVSHYIHLRGELDVDQLAGAVRRCAREMQSPRLRIEVVDGTPCQWVDSALEVGTQLIDLRDEEEPKAVALDWMRADAVRPVEAQSSPLTVNAVLRLGDREYFWYTRMHHITVDGYGAMTLANRVVELYNAATSGTAVPDCAAVSVAEIRESELAYRDSPRFGKDREFWRAQLAGVAGEFSLSTRSGHAGGDRLLERGRCDPSIHALQSATAPMVIAALASYCAAVTGVSEVVLSLPVTARTTAALRRSAGFVSNVVPLRIQVSAQATLGELLAQVSVRLTAALRHQRYRHEDIRRDCAAGSQRSFFGPMINIQLFHREIRLGEAQGVLHLLSTGPVEDLSVNLYASDGAGLHIDFEANPDRYQADELAGHHRRFLGYLARLLASTGPVADVPLLDEAERRLVLADWNATAMPVLATTLADRFGAQVARTPDAPALVFDNRLWSYRDIDARVNRLARRLIRAGAGPESVVALALPRGPELLIGMYAAVVAGAAYLPLDPEHPRARVLDIVAEVRPVAVLTTTGVVPDLPDRWELDTLDVSDESPAAIDDARRRSPLLPDHPAYVLFTSGSTGKPKGVLVSHRAIGNRLRWMQHAYPLGAGDTVVQKTPATFDVSVWELFWAWQVGARLVLAAPDGHRDPGYLADLIAEHDITTAHFVPSMLSVFLADPRAARARGLSRVFCSGEALAPELVTLFHAVLPGVELHNLYGPTEAAVDVTAWACQAPTSAVPIGAPVWNTHVYVLDAQLRPAPVGAAGELYLAGVQLARGYLGQGALTAQRFVANPHGEQGARMYRTGDLARWRSDGTLEYLGRTDFQVKIRGVRIELGEIESALLAQPQVRRAVCVARANRHGGQELIGYVVGAVAEPEELRSAVARMLPEHLVPRAVVVLPELPLTANGKVDRAALPAPRDTPDLPSRVADTAAEHAVAAIFADLLGRTPEEIGADTSFFDLGGDSLVAARAVARINAAFDATLTLRDLFEGPTVAQVAQVSGYRCNNTGGASGRSAGSAPVHSPNPTPRPRDVIRPPRVPLSAAQARLWVLNRFDRESAMYNMPFALRLTGELDVSALSAALTDVIARHEVLRTTFPDGEDGPEQRVHPSEPVWLTPEEVPAYGLPTRLAQLASGGFDLATQCPIRIALLRSGADEHTVVLVIHHIACDGWSFGPLARDVMTAFAARRVDAVPQWSPLPTQYAEFAVWQHAQLEAVAAGQVEYWSTTLANLPEQLDLPTDRPRPRRRDHAGGVRAFTIDATTQRGLAALAARHGVSMFMVMHSALAVLLARLSVSTDIAIGTPVAGRGHPDLDDLVGMFVNTVVLRTEIDPAERFSDFLRRVYAGDLAAFEHADVPFERVVDALAPERSPSRHPLFQVMLSYENQASNVALTLPGLRATVTPIDTGLTKIDLQLTIRDHGGTTLAGEFGYATDLFDVESIDSLVRRFTGILRRIAASADQAVGDLPLLDDHERAELCPMSTAPAEPAVTLPVLFSAAAGLEPDAVAVRYVRDGVELTYRELEEQSNRLARMLIRDGIGPESVVAVALPRSVESIQAIWAVTKTGAAYVPVDPSYPSARVAAMIADAGVRVGLTTTEHRAALPRDMRWYELDSPAVHARCVALSETVIGDNDRIAPLRAHHAAYLIYTSGSTGRPKAVVVTHAGIASFAWDAVDRYRLSGSSRVLHFSSPSFDASVLELLMGFAAGSTLVVASDDVYGGVELARLLRAERLTHAFVTPAALATVDRDGLDELGVVVVGGDEVGGDLVAQWAGGRRMFNAYGPSEVTIAATISAPLQPDAPVTIGAPIRGMRLLVLDQRLQPVPSGVRGELYVSGPGLARGYHARPALSATRFVANPYGVRGERMYRTGDVVVVARNRTLRFLGRSDDQVKVRGFRIELREIDSTLQRCPEVGFARTVVHTDEAGRTRLASYVTVTEPVIEADLIAAARAALPSYMVPAVVTVLDRIPLTPAGKFDRAALPAPEFGSMIGARAPQTEAERKLAGLFTEVLGCEVAGVEDSFFELGGNSLLATRLATKVVAAFGVEVPVRAIFEAPTVTGLLTLIVDAEPASERHDVVAGPRPERVPLSFAQRRLWFLNRMDTASSVYNIAFTLRLRGELDVAALRVALADVVARHEALRTVFPDSDYGPSQVVLPADEVSPALEPVPSTPDELPRQLRALAQRGYDVTVQPPLRAELFTLDSGEYALGVVIHHIAADGWSLTPLTADLMVAYQARLTGAAPASWAPLTAQYADYSLWQAKRLGDAGDPTSRAAVQLAYWTTHLADLPDELPLPYDRPRPIAPTYRGATVPVEVPDRVVDALRALARRHDVSLFMVLHTALAVLLRHVTGMRDIVVGTPVADRHDQALDGLIGMFVNTVVLRTEVDPHADFVTTLRGHAEADLVAMAHGEVPFEQVVDAVKPARVPARHPLFQVALSVNDQAAPRLELPGLRVDAEALTIEPAKFDLELRVTETTENRFGFEFSYSADVFDDMTIAGIGERFRRVLAAVAADPTVAVGDIDVLNEAERAELAPARGPRPARPVLLPDFLAAVAATNDTRIALRSGDIKLTYRALDRRANRLARALIARGVGPGDMVALGISRSVESVVATLGIVKTGAASVPIDPKYPAERIRHMLSDSGVAVGVTTHADSAGLPNSGVSWLDVADLDSGCTAPVHDEDRIRPLRMSDVAYVVYTSGSTGVPKGCAVTHSGLSNYADEQRDRFRVTSLSRVVHFVSPSFDASVLELLMALGCGATMVIAPTDVFGGDELAELLHGEKVTHAFITPAALATIDTDRYPLPCLRDLAVGGEAWGPELMAKWQAGRRLFNVYGPTETTIVAVMSEPMRPDGELVIGKPIRGVSALVLDERLRPVPTGVPGDLYLGGHGLARGYFRRPGLTAQRFVACPLGTPGERLYRTGDVVRWTPSGDLMFVGRSDDQVKVRGFRIELGEIDAVLGALPGIRFAHTEVRESRIVSYLLTGDADRWDPEDLRAQVAERLPAHMVPSAVVRLDHLPLTATGKLDRSALKTLPEPVFGAQTTTSRPPQTPHEKLVASIMQDVVAGAVVGAQDSFFDIGGNSLLATQIVARIATVTGHRLGVRAVFEHPTPERLAAVLDAIGPDASTHPALTRRERPDRIPLSLAQQRLWFLNRFDVDSAAYNIPVALRMRGTVDEVALAAALAALVQRHETLRTLYPDTPDGPYQKILSAAGPDLLRCLDTPDLDSAAATFAQRGFDLAHELPLRAALFTRAPDDHLLVLVLHHIAMDGWSLTPLATDLLRAYSGETVEPLPVQYTDYTLWQRDMLGSDTDPDSLAASQLEYWRTTLAGLPDHIDLPGDRPRPAAPSHQGGTVTVTVDAATHRAVLELARRHDASLFMVLHTALAVLLHRLAAVDDVVVGTALAGRADPQLDQLIGMFVGTLVLRAPVSGGESFAELLDIVRNVDLDAFAHADVPFERLVEVLNPVRSSAHHPLFQVMLSLHNLVPDTLATVPGAEVAVVPIDAGIAKFDLQFTITERVSGARGGLPSGLSVALNYASDLFDADTATQLAQRFARLLTAGVAHPETPVGDLELLVPAELAALSPVHGTAGTEITLPELFAASVKVNPGATALIGDGQVLTYRELDRRTNRLARLLVDAGVGPDSFVALGLPRSVDSVVAMLAVSKAGGAFVPIDPNYPAERTTHMVADSGVTVGVTRAAHRTALPGTVRWLELDDPAVVRQLQEQPDGPPALAVRRDARVLSTDAAYLVYTSGSTGVPKGVVVTHGGLSNFAYETAERFSVSPAARVLHFASPSFDAAVLDVLFALGGAATLVIAPPGIFGGAELTRVLVEGRITHAFITTAALATADPGAVRELTHVLVGGEACPPELVARWAPGRSFHNVYGPTETTIVTTMGAPLSPGERITIGGPIRGVSALVLDARLRPVAVGVTGELYLAGPGLARGYHHRPALTAGRFVANPHGKPGERMYRTGDRVRWSRQTATLELEYVGRTDHQVKIRGFRIEPGEIDAVLARHADVEFSVTLGVTAPSGAAVLVSYVKPPAGGSASVEALRAHCAGALPNYMVPQVIMTVDQLPLTPVGKLDRAALPEPTFVARAERQPPRTPVETAVCEVFAEVLGVAEVGVQDSFFELGGNSLLATRVVAELAQRHRMQVPVQAMFVDPTPAGLAVRVGANDPAAVVDAALAPLLPIRVTGTKPPLFCVHPAVGLSWCYTGLLPHLDPDQPVYGLQSPLLSDASDMGTVEDLAARYIAEIIAVQPEGPYHLLGWSFGGLVAHEMAVQLTGAGADVALLAMMDSYVLSRWEEVPAHLIDPGIADLLAEFGGQIGLPEGVSTLEQAAAALSDTSGPFAALTLAHLERMYAGYRAAADLAGRFKPGRYRGDLLFFTAAADERANRETVGKAGEWSTFVRGEITDHAIDCTHSAMTTPEALAAIGPLLRAGLEDAADEDLTQAIARHPSGRRRTRHTGKAAR